MTYIRNEVKIKKLHPDAIIPKYQHATDSCVDLHAIDTRHIQPGKRVVVGTGIGVEMPPNMEAQVRSRSGFASKYGVFVLNSPGTVDEGYRGEIKVILHNAGNSVIGIHPGDRIAQLAFVPILRPSFVVVDELSDSDRGANGFGSTGV